jgi:hypothetical protein
MKQLIRSSSLLLAIVALGFPADWSKAATPVTNSSAAVVPAKKPVPGPFHGKVAAVDKQARTIQVGKRTFYVGPECKLTKAGKPAKLEAAVVGEECGGYMKPSPDGRLVATTLRLGPKVDVPAPAPAAASPSAPGRNP